jgi:hypothetical protein
MARRAPFETTVDGTPVHVRRWHGYGKQPRLYVETADGDRLGYWCLTTARAVVAESVDAATAAPVVTAAAAELLAAEGEGVPPTVVQDRARPDDGGEAGTPPAAPAEAREERLAGPVAAPAEPAAELPAELPDEPPADEPPASEGAPTSSGAEVLLSMDDDLARNRPGAALRLAMDTRRASLSPVRRLWDDVSGATRRDSWHVGWRGERLVGKSLDRWAAKDTRWRVLHSIPDPVPGFNPDKDIDHLVIGPTGVFAINTKHYRGASITIGDTVAWIRGHSENIPAKAHREARRAGRRLRTVCGFPVDVVPVLAFVAPRELTMSRRRPDDPVFVVHHRGLIDGLRSHPGRPIPEFDVSTLYEAARRRSTWQG